MSRRHVEAETANRAKDMFLATLSHEMRTPLNAIVGWISILRDKGCEDEDLVEGLDVIERNTKAQVQLIEDVLDVSRIVCGKLRLEMRAANCWRLSTRASTWCVPARRRAGHHARRAARPIGKSRNMRCNADSAGRLESGVQRHQIYAQRGKSPRDADTREVLAGRFR